MNLSEIKHVLAVTGIRLTRSLGQNFLHDGNQLRRIVAAAELKKSDRVLEIGPGLGALTGLLLQQAGEVLAIEKDARLAGVLEARLKASQMPADSRSTAGLSLVVEDALDFIRRERRDWSEWKLVANLPYSAASPILVELAQAGNGPQQMVATLQLEVARRLMAKTGDADYGVLTLLIQLDYEPINWFKIPAACFFPEPDVDSACICLARRGQPLLPADQKPTFCRIVKRSFSQRRKMMFKLLRNDWPQKSLEEAFERAKLPAQVRAEAVSLEQFVLLARMLSANPHYD